MFLRRSIGLGLALSLVTAGNASAQDTPPSAPGSQAAPQNVLTKAPELLQFVEAVRPPGTEALEGVVVLMLTLQADGRVSDVVVESAAGQGFDEAAVAAARQFVRMLGEYALLSSQQAQRDALGALLGPLVLAGAMTTADVNALIAAASVQIRAWDIVLTAADIAFARTV
jgi:TonB family protein